MPKKTTVDENKPWQHGYPLEYLKGLESHWAEYNSKVRSPFAAFKKNHIAAALHAGEFFCINKAGLSFESDLHRPEDCIAYVTLSTAKVRSEIVMFQDDVIGVKEKDDRVIQRFVCKPGYEMLFTKTLFQAGPTHPLWVYILEEDEQQRKIMAAAGLERVGVKINTNADIFGVYFRDRIPNSLELAMGDFEQRVHPKVIDSELVTLGKFSDIDIDISGIAAKVSKLGEFTNHFSNYNPTNSWSALSLIGYKKDPAFISKPGVMDGKNQVEDGADLKVQETLLAPKFPDAIALAKYVAGKGTVDRLRFMKLQPGGGELTRHTDLVEKEAGTRDGQIMRVHFPIITNDKVDFTVWNVDAKRVTVNMKVNEAWYLDLRKPHTVVNGGDTVRVHLVADIRLTEDPKSDVRRFLNANSRIA